MAPQKSKTPYEKQPPFYMAMLNHERQRYNHNWPEVCADEVKTLYPNLLAEKYASGYSLSTLANHAQVSEDVMIDVFQGGGDLELDEYFRLVGLFGLRSSRGLEYLSDRQLRMVDPTIEEDEGMIKELSDLIQSIPAPVPQISWSFQQLKEYRKKTGSRFYANLWSYELATSTDRILKAGKTVPYAVLRWSVSGLRRELNLLSKPKIRTHRIEPVDEEVSE